MMSVSSVRRRLGHFFQDFSVLRFSALDLRVILRIACFIVLWKFLSVDYSAFPALLKGPEFFSLPAWLSIMAHGWQACLFDQVWKVQLLQWFSALCLGFTLWRLNRLTLLLGLLPVLLVEWNAFFYRNQMYDLDVPTALLLLALLGPWRKMMEGDGKISVEATWTGFMLAVYMGGAYFMSGWSKLALDPHWWQHVRLDLLYPTMALWHGYTFPDWLQPWAYGLHRLLTAFPRLAEALALLTLLLELGWWLSLFNRTARFWLPLAMLGCHFFIFLSSGILFLTLAVMAFVLVVPWRHLLSPLSLAYAADDPLMGKTVQTVRRWNWLGLVRLEPQEMPAGAISASDCHGTYTGLEALLRAALRCPMLAFYAALAFVPGVSFWLRPVLQLRFCPGAASGLIPVDFGPVRWQSSVPASLLICVLIALWYPTTCDSFFPFARYNQFGWSYAKTAQPATVYRLGYLNAQTGAIQPLPNNYGGFFDYRLVQLPGQYIEMLLNSPVNQQAALAMVGQFVQAIRGNHSDRCYLGPLAFPDHFVAKSEEIPPDWLRDIYLLEGHYTYDGRALHSDWVVRGKLRRG